MDGTVAGLADHQCFPVQGNHCQYPVGDGLAALVVFLLDVLQFTDVVDFKLAWCVRLVAAQFALVGVEPVKNAMAQREGDVHYPLCGIPWCGLVLLPERLVEVGQGLCALFGLVRDPEQLPCPGLLLEFDIHSVFTDDLGYRALFLARDRFEQTVVVKEFVLPEFGADVSCQAVVVVQPSDFSVVEGEGVQQRGVDAGVVMDGFSVADEGFQFLSNDLGRNEQLDGFVGGTFLDPLTVLGEFGVLLGLGDFVAQEADTAVAQVGDHRFLRAEHEAQRCQKTPDFFPDVLRQSFAADDHDDEVVGVAAVFDLDVVRVKRVLYVHGSHPL